MNWLLTRPTVGTVIVGARNEEQLRQNLGAVGWALTADQLARLDKASALTPPSPYYPYYRLADFARLNAPAA
ncbi:aldo/keto reductase [Nocardia grenadensis]|uniref:aldo/keto reductase n=1 Tax=Nocardia grenadensis TaxID=931537 RepID=UPI003D8EED94